MNTEREQIWTLAIVAAAFVSVITSVVIWG